MVSSNQKFYFLICDKAGKFNQGGNDELHSYQTCKWQGW